MSKNIETVEVKAIRPQIMTVHIVGDSDLVLNKMDDVTARELADTRKDKAKTTEKPNEWEKIITSIHWREGKPKEFTEETFIDALKNNAPCFTVFGYQKSLGEAVTRFEIDTYSTKFDANVNVLGKGGLIPIKFAEHSIDERLMSPKKGSPILTHIHHFGGWSADIEISFLEKKFSAEQIINVINLAGFGIGIGSGRRSCGYGRYHVEGIK